VNDKSFSDFSDMREDSLKYQKATDKEVEVQCFQALDKP
jgi:hypothetical protein